MADYLITIASSAGREMERLPHQAQERIARAIDNLPSNPRPHGVEKLSGYRDLYRIRVGQYRVVYRIVDREQLIDVIRIRTRGDAYRR